MTDDKLSHMERKSRATKAADGLAKYYTANSGGGAVTLWLKYDEAEKLLDILDSLSLGGEETKKTDLTDRRAAVEAAKAKLATVVEIP